MAWPTLTTDRLVLRPLCHADLDALHALHAEESFWRYPFGRGWTRNETVAFLDRTVRRYAEGEMAVSAVVTAQTGELAGWAGLSVPHFLPSVLPAVEVGWRLGEAHRGRGYATEAGAAWVGYGFDELGLDSILSIYEPENEASGAVMRRLGFTLDRATSHPTLGVTLHVTSLDRATWNEQQRTAP